MQKNEPLKLNDNDTDFERKFYVILNNKLLLSAIAFCAHLMITISNNYFELSVITLSSIVFIVMFVFIYNVISISYIVIFAIIREIKLFRINHK